MNIWQFKSSPFGSLLSQWFKICAIFSLSCLLHTGAEKYKTIIPYHSISHLLPGTSFYFSVLIFLIVWKGFFYWLLLFLFAFFGFFYCLFVWLFFWGFEGFQCFSVFILRVVLHVFFFFNLVLVFSEIALSLKITTFCFNYLFLR